MCRTFTVFGVVFIRGFSGTVRYAYERSVFPEDQLVRAEQGRGQFAGELPECHGGGVHGPSAFADVQKDRKNGDNAKKLFNKLRGGRYRDIFSADEEADDTAVDRGKRNRERDDLQEDGAGWLQKEGAGDPRSTEKHGRGAGGREPAGEQERAEENAERRAVVFFRVVFGREARDGGLDAAAGKRHAEGAHRERELEEADLRRTDRAREEYLIEEACCSGQKTGERQDKSAFQKKMPLIHMGSVRAHICTLYAAGSEG